MSTPTFKNIPANSEEVQRILSEIVDATQVDQIYVYSHKVNAKGEITTFKLAVICSGADPREVERRLYGAIDSEIPFDIMVYSRTQWEALLKTPFSFVGRIVQMGVVVYGQEATE